MWYPGTTEVTVKIDPSGWAWLVGGRKLFVWRYKPTVTRVSYVSLSFLYLLSLIFLLYALRSHLRYMYSLYMTKVNLSELLS